MEKIVRIITQSALVSRQYTDRKSGTEKVMNAVTLQMTDGVDQFIGEVTGERAVNLPVLDRNQLYHVQCTMMVREWMNQQGEMQKATNIYVDRIAAI